MAKNLYQLEAKLGGTVNGDLPKEAFTASITVVFKDSDSPNATNQRTPDPNTKLFEIDPKNTQGKQSEYILCESHSTTDGVTTLVNVTRGLPRDGTIDLTGSADRAQQWSSPPIGVATEPFNINYMRKMFLGTENITNNLTLSGNNTFSGTNAFNGINTHTKAIIMNGTTSYLKIPVLTTTQRDALTPTEGIFIYNTTEGIFQGYQAGLWIDFDSGTVTPNASTIVAGKVEIATTAESIAATNVGGTGAFLTILPTDIAANTQNNVYIFGSSTTGNDTYIFNPTPAVTTLANGQRFLIKVDTANTEACTLNVSGLGAVAIKLNSGGDPETGDIPANSIIDVVYNSTGPKFVLQGTPALLTNNTDASLHHYHDPARNNHYSNRLNFRGENIEPFENGGVNGSNNSKFKITSTATNNSIAGAYITFFTLVPTEVAVSVHNKNPEFWTRGGFTTNTAQDCFIGLVNYTMTGTSLENSVMTLDHFGFIVQDATLFISVANGTTQSKTDISALVPNVNVVHTYRAYFDGTTAYFFVDGVSVGTLTGANVPDGNLERFGWFAIPDVSAVAKTLLFWKSTWVTVDVI